MFFLDGALPILLTTCLESALFSSKGPTTLAEGGMNLYKICYPHAGEKCLQRWGAREFDAMAMSCSVRCRPTLQSEAQLKDTFKSWAEKTKERWRMPFKGRNLVSSQQCSLPRVFHDNKVLDKLCANHTSLNGSYFPYDLHFHLSADLSSFLPLATILTACLLVLASLADN